MVLRLEPAPAIRQDVVAVVDEVRRMLEAAPFSAAYRAALATALTPSGRILSGAPDARWTHCVSTCCIAAGGRWEQAVPTAATLELLMPALELLDDLEDGEVSPLHSELGPARLLNVATGLLLMAHRHVLNQEPDSQAANILLAWVLQACNGQDADLSTESSGDIDLPAALEITEQKSASLVAAACQLGALCAGADLGLQARYARFGGYLGMVAQLVNDMRAVTSDVASKTDITLHRPTLPLVYASVRLPITLEQEGRPHDPTGPLGIAPLALTWVVAESYRGRALDLIPDLTADPAARHDLMRLVRVL